MAPQNVDVVTGDMLNVSCYESRGTLCTRSALWFVPKP